MDTTQYEAMQQAFADLAAAMIRVARAIAQAIWEALEPLARWVGANQGKSFLAGGLAASREVITLPFIVVREAQNGPPSTNAR